MKIIAATRWHILKLKCTKFDFGWGAVPRPRWGAYSTLAETLAGFHGPASKGKEDRAGECNTRGKVMGRKIRGSRGLLLGDGKGRERGNEGMKRREEGDRREKEGRAGSCPTNKMIPLLALLCCRGKWCVCVCVLLVTTIFDM